MAALVASREISAVELMTAHLKQIAQINPALNAIVDLLDQPALDAAHAADKQLANG